MFTTACKNNMLDAASLALASLHSGFPGQTGVNEIFGGSPAYARKAITVSAASGGLRALAVAVTFDVPPSTIRWIGFWGTGSAQFQGYSPNGGNPREFFTDIALNVINLAAHGFASGQKVVFYNDTIPGGLVEGQVYYVVNPATDSFQVSASSGGAPIDITSTNGSGCLCSPIVEENYASQGAHTITAGNFSLNY